MNSYRTLLSSACLLAPMIGWASPTSTNAPDISAFIVGGQPTTTNQIPFYARVILYRPGTSQYVNLCGGSIVNDRYIMTAAHCVESEVYTDGWTIDNLRVLVKNPSTADVFTDEFKDVRTITIHPQYVQNDLWINDIALIELSYPITDNVQSITLPQDFGDYSDQTTYQIFGLGLTSSNNQSGPDFLRWAEIQPLSDAQCSSLVNGYHSQESLCANGFEGRAYTGICQGDSGGPLTYQDDNGEYQQIGLTSYGSSVCDSPSIPSVFTEILNYTSWIEAVTSNGIKTSYDASLAATEDYHSVGDSGASPVKTTLYEPELNTGSGNPPNSGSSNSGSSGGGSLGWLTLALGALVGLRRKWR